MSDQNTFIMVKPDGVARGLVGDVISRFEAKGLTLNRMRLLTISAEMAGEHYGEHVGKPFYQDLVDFITSGPVVAMDWSGPDAVQVGRTLMGPTNPVEAPPGTIRGDFGLEIGENIVHGSDSAASAERELGIFFG